MTKREYHNEINRRFYDFINHNYKDYEINDEMGGRILLVDKDDNIIEYHQSQHTVETYGWHAEDEDKVKDHADDMRNFLNTFIISQVKKEYEEAKT
jgi:hypothetical protein